MTTIRGYSKSYLESILFGRAQQKLDNLLYEKKISHWEHKQESLKLLAKDKTSKYFLELGKTKGQFKVKNIERKKEDNARLIHDHRSMAARNAITKRSRDRRGRLLPKGQAYSQAIGPGNYKGKSPDDSETTAVTITDVHSNDQNVKKSNNPEGRTITVTNDYDLPNVGPTQEWEDMVMELNDFTRVQLMQKYIAKVGELTHCKRELKKCDVHCKQLEWELDKATEVIRTVLRQVPSNASTEVLEALNEYADDYGVFNSRHH